MQADFYLPPRQGQADVAAEERWRAIEDSLYRAAMVELPPFSLPGPVTVAESGRYYPAIQRRVVQIAASLSTPGTSTTTVEWRKNDGVAATLSLASGVSLVTATVSVDMADTDYLTMATTAAGTGAKGLVVHSRAVGTLT